MATLVRQPDGKKLIQLMDGSGRRRTIRLGRIDVKPAQTFLAHIESLVAARSTVSSIDGTTAAWVGKLDDRMHGRLAAVGLIGAREVTQTTVGGLLATYFDNLNVKAGTARTYQQTRRSLEGHFGTSTLLTSISELDADRWRQALKDEKLAEATISKRVKTARQIFKQAVRWKMLSTNPFSEVRAGSQTNRSRMYFVPLADVVKIMDACPDAEWRLIIALSRFGGMRCPSEHLALRWRDVDGENERITVWSPKTERHEGGEVRVMPLFPELRECLQDAFDQAKDGAEFVINRRRDPSCNLRTHFLRIIARAGVRPWPKLFHNLRSSRQTELTEHYPSHVVCDWLGNSPAIAANHYLQVLDKHLEAAAATRTPAGALQNALQQGAEGAKLSRNRRCGQARKPRVCKALRLLASCCRENK